MKKKELFGIVPAMITPLNEDCSLDIDGLERLINYLLGSGVHGLFIAGYTGEGAALTYETLSDLVKYTKIFVKDRVSICCGVLETGTEKTRETAKKLIDEGMNFLTTTVPYTPPVSSQEDILRHYEIITKETNAKWVVYGNSGVLPNIEPQTFHLLAQMDNVSAIKDTRPDYEGHLKNLVAIKNDDVNFLCGGEYLVGPGLLAGADGNISGATNLYPRIFVELYKAAKASDVNRVNAYARDIAEIHSMTNLDNACWLSAFKYSCYRMGLIKEHCVFPVKPVQQEEKMRIDRLLEKFATWI